MLKRIGIALGIAKLAILIYLVITITISPSIEAINYKKILGAHRGDSVENIENTLPAIKAAVKNEKYNFIEFDVQYTKDKKIVVYHDKTLFRLQQKMSSIRNLTHQELEEISSFSIPLYSDVMDAIGSKKKINIEIKSSEDIELDFELVDFIVKDIENRGILKNVMLSSISKDIVKYISDKHPGIKTGKVYWVTYSTFMPFEFFTNELYGEMDETGADYLMLYGANIRNIDNLIELKPEDKTVVVWYFNNEMYIIQKDKTDGLW